tara:strand:- start:42343 stop:43152 length:810 start_codon:yes stop_codon:yes gene_type:complete
MIRMNDCICNSILNLNSNSTFKDARSNYLKLCLKFHPDKNNGNSEEFIRINEAYDYYVSNHKSYKVISLQECLKSYQCYLICLGCFLKTKDIQLQLKIQLEDIYNIKTKRIVYSRLMSDFLLKKEVLYLELSGFQYRYEIDSYGDFNVISGQYNNLIVDIEIIYPDLMHINLNDTLSMYDLYYNIDINIYEYYFGLQRDLPYFNDDTIKTRGHIPNQEGDILVINDMGLMNDENKREKLYIFFKIDMNMHNLNDEDEYTVKKLFNVIIK